MVQHLLSLQYATAHKIYFTKNIMVLYNFINVLLKLDVHCVKNSQYIKEIKLSYLFRYC